jgi:hypothetical protein
MAKSHSNTAARTRLAAIPALLLASLAAAACSTEPKMPDFGGIDFRETRYQDVAALRDFRDCRDQAVELDSQARTSGDPARYLSSAELLERCDRDLGPDASVVPEDERMRAHGLAIQNYIKGGDGGAARRELERFKQLFPGKDLYYADGASFRTTMEVLLGQHEERDFGRYSMLNVSTALKGEMRRIQYWKHN